MLRKKKFQKKLQELVKSNDYEVYFEDECHFKLTLTLIRAWFLKGSTPQIKSPNDRFKMSIFGSLEFIGDYANSLCNLNKKNSVSTTPLKLALNSLILELKDSAFAFVFLLSKKFKMLSK
jgi:hypothetical protein